MSSAENKRRTKYISRTLNPEWEQVVFYRNIHPLDLQKKSVEFTVWDYDRFSPNDFMGEVLIDLTDNHYLDNRPRWFKLHEHDENNSAELPKPKTLSPTMSRRRQHSTAAPIALQKSRSHTDVMDDQPIMEHRQGSRIDQKARSLTQLAQTESSENAKDQPYGTTPLKAKRPHMQSSFWKEDPISKTIAHVTDCPVNLENERQKTATTTPITFSSSTLPSARSSSTIRTRSSRKDYSPDEPHDAARVALAAAEAVVLQLQPALTEQESQYYNAPLQIQKPYISDETIQLGASQLEPSTDIPIRRTLSAGDATPSIEHLASTSILRRRHGYGSSDTTDSSETGTPRSSRHSSRDRSRSKTSPHRTIREESVTSTISSYYTATDSAMPSMNYGQADSYHMPPLQPITSAHAHTEEHGRDMSPGTHQYGKESKRSPSHHHHQHRSHSRSKHEKHRSRSIETNQFPTEHMGQFSTHSLPSNVSFTRTPSETYIPNLDCRSEAMLDAHTSGYSDTPWIARQPPGAQDIHMNTKAAMYTRMLLGDLGPGQVIDPEMPSKPMNIKHFAADVCDLLINPRWRCSYTTFIRNTTHTNPHVH
uniref:Regulating synaptic membrane exocytosis protein 1-like n=1 Tax=Saccoglossus kowalevskii TaxID=10224 RepID=A0ABM0MZ00_SACKO|nr:PREDICTED: regulating synaptic membrane exocytosis protein 1-like [Saccoglossus kowalevskii]